MNVKIWTVITCIPDDTSPCWPVVFGTAEGAEAYAEEMLRSEWQYNSPCDEDGNAQTYPGSWREANDIIASETNGQWGQWEITSHEVEIPDFETEALANA